MKVVYEGKSDFQVFSKEDWKKAELEFGKTLSFPKSEPVEVDQEVGEALIAKEGIFHDFAFSQVEEEAEKDPEEQGVPETAKEKKARLKAEAEAQSSSSQESLNPSPDVTP